MNNDVLINRAERVIGSSNQTKILVALYTWPSKEHPYLIYLFSALKQHFPALQLYMFHKSSAIPMAEVLIGKNAVEAVLADALYRFKPSHNPLAYIKPLVSVTLHAGKAFSVYTQLRAAGFTRYHAIGQLLYTYPVFCETFDLVYINALQLAKHLPLRQLVGKTPIVVSSRGQDFDIQPDGYDAVLQQIDHLHVLGQHLEQQALARGFKSNNITRIPPAVLPIQKMTPRQQSGKKIKIISVSRLYWIKGYAYALRAIYQLKQQLGNDVFEYCIVGDGPEMEEIQVEIDRLQLRNQVTLTGWLDQAGVNEKIHQSDVFLLLSIGEGFNNAVMQAQQAGLPCVVSDAGGLPENVLHEQTGYVVPRYNVTAACEALAGLVTKEAKRVQMGEAARARMASEFSLDIQIKQYVEMFRSQLKRA
jgi:glycosyltransferase involved in cell wall biosynthesis